MNLRPGAMLATPAVLGSGRVFVDAAVDGDCASAGELRGRSRSGYIGEPGRGGEDDRAAGQLVCRPIPRYRSGTFSADDDIEFAKNTSPN